MMTSSSSIRLILFVPPFAKRNVEVSAGWAKPCSFVSDRKTIFWLSS